MQSEEVSTGSIQIYQNHGSEKDDFKKNGSDENSGHQLL